MTRPSRRSWRAIWKKVSTATHRQFAHFTDVFFHRPEELSSEFLNAGLQVLELLAIESRGWLARDFERLRNDPQQRERLLSAVQKTESEPSVLGTSSHIMAIARK
jgi:hypothetical protein